VRQQKVLGKNPAQSAGFFFDQNIIMPQKDAPTVGHLKTRVNRGL